MYTLQPCDDPSDVEIPDIGYREEDDWDD